MSSLHNEAKAESENNNKFRPAKSTEPNGSPAKGTKNRLTTLLASVLDAARFFSRPFIEYSPPIMLRTFSVAQKCTSNPFDPAYFMVFRESIVDEMMQRRNKQKKNKRSKVFIIINFCFVTATVFDIIGSHLETAVEYISNIYVEFSSFLHCRRLCDCIEDLFLLLRLPLWNLIS